MYLFKLYDANGEVVSQQVLADLQGALKKAYDSGVAGDKIKIFQIEDPELYASF